MRPRGLAEVGDSAALHLQAGRASHDGSQGRERRPSQSARVAAAASGLRQGRREGRRRHERSGKPHRAWRVRAARLLLRGGGDTGGGCVAPSLRGAARPKCPGSWQPTQPPTAPETHPFPHGRPLGPRGEPLPLKCRREATAALRCAHLVIGVADVTPAFGRPGGPLLDATPHAGLRARHGGAQDGRRARLDTESPRVAPRDQ